MATHEPDHAEYRVTDALGYLLHHAHRVARQRAEEVFLGADLGFVQWVALMHLRDGLVDTSSGLARCLGHDSGAITRMLDQLEERGLIRRARSTTDRRVIHLALTPDGLAAANRLIPQLVAHWEKILLPFTDTEVGQLKGLLLRLLARLDDRTGEAGR